MYRDSISTILSDCKDINMIDLCCSCMTCSMNDQNNIYIEINPHYNSIFMLRQSSGCYRGYASAKATPKKMILEISYLMLMNKLSKPSYDQAQKALYILHNSCHITT